MRIVTATEAKHHFASVIEAASREPVKIQSHKRDIAVVISMQEYERLANFTKTEFQRFCDQVGTASEKAGMTEEKLAELLASEE